jgi:serine/threonine-protein kinase
MVVVPEPLPRVARLISSDSVPVGGFAPGVILADRYRIIGLLGRGGMGEVYRADDIKLGQAVALKFLPPALADDPVRRERFFAEVRIARQLAHPNVCRVYDISEYEGRHFLSMEYIDGEDLASLLQRIGHLSNEKAVDIARQLASGLSAAHERGVLHRDLKPSNVMLDGHGRVRITDFGLAIAVDDEAQATEVSGTPAYMAPEQLAGKGATVRSDVYSLGLILYEIYTGKRAFKATSIADLRAQKATHTPTAPSDLRPGVDPVVERLIMRCLEKEPTVRPASVAQLAAALPGGDALAAAIAAGETPSPDLLIASGSKEGLRPAAAVALVVFIVAGTVAAAFMSDRVSLAQRANLTRPPDALVERARDLLRESGYAEDAAVDSASGFFVDGDAALYAADTLSDRQNGLEAAGVVGYLYRESPRPLLGVGPLGGVEPNNPVMEYAGEVAIQLDGQGRLRSFRAVPPRTDSDAPVASTDWPALFSAAGLEIEQWMPSDPQWTPVFFADSRVAWTGTLPYAPNDQARIEAASFRGKPVSFVVVGPWTPTNQVQGFTGGVQRGSSSAIYVFLVFIFLVLGSSAAFFAHQNLRLGRGDRRGATRVMLLTLTGWTISWLAIEHHVASFGEVALAAAFIGLFIPIVSLLWVFYIAVEPFARRRWPAILVSWNRVLTGDFRDPLVGRDLVIGVAAGVAVIVIVHATAAAQAALGHPLPQPPPLDWNMFNGPRSFVGSLFGFTSSAVGGGLAMLLELLLYRVLLRRDWAAIVALVAHSTIVNLGAISWIVTAGTVVTAILSVFVLVRVGLLATVVHLAVLNWLLASSLTAKASAWYAGIGYGVVLVCAIITLYGLRTALGGRPTMSTVGMDD